MIIRIGSTGDPAGVELVEADVFDRLHVEAEEGATRAQIDDALRRARAGSFDYGVAQPVIDSGWIRHHAHDDTAWTTSFEAMLAFAQSRGWYSAEAGTIQAHVESRPSAAVSADEFRAAFRGYPAGVAVITADDGTGPVGLTATSVISVSAQPPLVVFSVSQDSSSSPTLTAASSVVVHLLGSRDLWAAKLCATSGIDRFADTSLWSRLPTGEPYFPTTTRWLRADVVSTSVAGTSTIVIVHVVETGSSCDGEQDSEAAPLVYHNRTWHALSGHSELEVRAG
ncbi:MULTISPECIES: flavin reductase family protein [Microbacterium]|uniref:flavin reductase family protein n=1 Tax=Microbacterium TaxID=33882 RepID=UPI0027823BBB|nr:MULTISPECIES: flavin reductase family protein [Microbacterium]MDQ1074150.1 flavin reductase (DIM6/NTAB) family NADH-FMN oxidoreductase RutF [Microbacterium sp. SORGH_AS_0969]MDQ1114376.1 flavin reductase (DIM6/NTAB) family NADH-FMN oxidoreductase RutF [Microbacterium testaceum]